MRDGALVILRSTVKLGTARAVVAPVLRASGRPFDIAVCPERTLEGRALIEVREIPQIIGADTPEIRDRCSRIFGALTPTTVTLSSLEAAELTKLIDNTYRDVMFGFANEVARICSHTGLSALEVIRAGRYGYPRTNVALPGPVGGPCLEKDAHILVESAREAGIELNMAAAGRTINERQPAETIGLLRARCAATPGFAAAPVISVAGLAFKGFPPTDDLRGTMARPIIAAIREEFPHATIRGYDPLVAPAAAREAFDIDTVPDLGQAFAGADIVILANNHYELQRMDVAAFAQRMRAPGFVYDYWNLHDDIDRAMPKDISYLGLGAEKYGMSA
jgi:UDP-N-acetyl-D-mannosaminuronic acid dehydrogenase